MITSILRTLYYSHRIKIKHLHNYKEHEITIQLHDSIHFLLLGKGDFSLKMTIEKNIYKISKGIQYVLIKQEFCEGSN